MSSQEQLSDDEQTHMETEEEDEDDGLNGDFDYDLEDDDFPDELEDDTFDAVPPGDDPNCMYGLDGYRWSIYPTVGISTASRSSTVTEVFPQLKGAAKTTVFSDAGQIWDLLITSEMIDRIVAATNKEIDMKRSESQEKKKNDCSTDATEIRALFGLLYLIGAYKNVNEDLTGLYASDGTGRIIFPAAMGHKRVLFLLRNLRFDGDPKDDQMPHLIRHFANFFDNSRRNFSPGADLTVDQVLTKSHIKVHHKASMKNVPGIKSFFIVDAMTSYVLNGHILDFASIPDDLSQFNQPTQLVLQLISPLSLRDRNITGSLLYTSIELAYELQSRGYTYVGPMSPKERQMAPNFVQKTKRRVGSAIYGFNGRTTIVSYMEKKNSPVVLLSTMHHQATNVNGKPEMYRFYEASKTAIPASEKTASIRGVFKNCHWTVDLFNQLLDFAGINAHQIYQMTLGEIKYRDFIIALGRALIEPELERRQNMVGAHREIQESINKVMGNSPFIRPEAEEEPLVGKKKRCALCPKPNNNKCISICVRCKKNACKKCHKILCYRCFE